MENRINRGYLVVLKGRKIGQNLNSVKQKIVEIETAEIEECPYTSNSIGSQEVGKRQIKNGQAAFGFWIQLQKGLDSIV